MKTLKSLYLVPSFPYPPTSGGQIRTMNIFKFLAGKGPVTLVTPYDEKQHQQYLKDIHPLCHEAKLIPNEKFGPHSAWIKKPTRWKQLIKLLQGIPWVLQDFISEDFLKTLLSLDLKSFDAIVIRYPVLGYYFLRHPELKKYQDRIIIDVDDILMQVEERRVKSLPLGYKKFRHWVELVLLHRFYKKFKNMHACLVASQKDEVYMKEYRLARRTFILPNIVPMNGLPPKPDSKSGAEILFCGTLSFNHNVDAIDYFVSKIFPLIQNKIPGAHFTIIGRNPSVKLLKLNEQPGIQVVGFVPDTEPYYKKAQVVIAPILNGAGTKIKVLEAMTFERAVVATLVGAEGLDVTAGENIVIADNPQDFADACVKLIENEVLRKKIAEGGYQLVKEHYSLEVFHARMDKALQSLTAS